MTFFPQAARQIGKKVGLFLGYLVYLLLIIEVCSAIYSLSGLSPTRHMPPYVFSKDEVSVPLGDWRTEFEDWGAWHQPNSKTRHIKACFDVTYRSNAAGARDKPRTLAAAEHPRYIVLGDSFIEGWGVDEGARVTERLEAMTGHEFLNFGGAINFGPLQYEILYRQLAGRFEHDAVIVFLLPDNDFIDNDPAYWPSSTRYRPLFDAQGNAVYRVAKPDHAVTFSDKDWLPRSFLRYLWSYGIVLDVKRLLAAKNAHINPRRTAYVGYRDPNAKQINDVFSSLKRLHAAAAPRDVYLAAIPRVNDIQAYHQGEMLPLPGILTGFARQQGIVMLDLLPLLAAHPDYLSLYLPCDGHWNAQGHQVVADAIYQAWFKQPDKP
ncbi:MAG: hypothetical protein EPN21_11310 [Methylococcaceae bacterium]|nr:MAG: hypothetical protein EPN21_11310 [Methylococcaceae bacterium]